MNMIKQRRIPPPLPLTIGQSSSEENKTTVVESSAFALSSSSLSNLPSNSPTSTYLPSTTFNNHPVGGIERRHSLSHPLFSFYSSSIWHPIATRRPRSSFSGRNKSPSLSNGQPCTSDRRRSWWASTLCWSAGPFRDDFNVKRTRTTTSFSAPRSMRTWVIWSLLLLIGFVGLRLLWTRYHIPYYVPSIMDREPGNYYARGQRRLFTTQDWPWKPCLHIVKTRFMQEQGHLTALAQARYALFRIFCLPTMQRQTTQEFLWIIKVDPHLPRHLLRAMIWDVQDHPNFFLVASNVNFRINEAFPGAWRGGAEGRDLAHSAIYTGNRTLLELALALHDQLPVLETRLDADDGLHHRLLDRIQTSALQRWQQYPNVRWMYFCSRRHIEWHWTEAPQLEKVLLAAAGTHYVLPRPTSQKDDGDDDGGGGGDKANEDHPAATDAPHGLRELATMMNISPTLLEQMVRFGALTAIQHSKLCITPGITTGFAVGVPERQVPVYAHDQLIKKLDQWPANQTSCGMTKPADCLQFLESFAFDAIRARCPTSAGMLKVMVSSPQEIIKDWWAWFAFANMLHESFGIRREQLSWMNQYISTHLIDIARDNLLGQCTTGHSCKDKAKASLSQLVASRNGTSKVD